MQYLLKHCTAPSMPHIFAVAAIFRPLSLDHSGAGLDQSFYTADKVRFFAVYLHSAGLSAPVYDNQTKKCTVLHRKYYSIPPIKMRNEFYS